MDTVFEINGVNMLPYVAYKGIKWQRSDLDSSSTTRMLNGELRRKRVATKIRLDITCRPLKLEEAKIVLTAIMPEFVTVRYTDPQLGTTTTKTMYSNNNPASHLINTADASWWDGIEFPLIEK